MAREALVSLSDARCYAAVMVQWWALHFYKFIAWRYDLSSVGQLIQRCQHFFSNILYALFSNTASLMPVQIHIQHGMHTTPMAAAHRWTSRQTLHKGKKSKPQSVQNKCWRKHNMVQEHRSGHLNINSTRWWHIDKQAKSSHFLLSSQTEWMAFFYFMLSSGNWALAFVTIEKAWMKLSWMWARQINRIATSSLGSAEFRRDHCKEEQTIFTFHRRFFSHHLAVH